MHGNWDWLSRTVAGGMEQYFGTFISDSMCRSKLQSVRWTMYCVCMHALDIYVSGVHTLSDWVIPSSEEWYVGTFMRRFTDDISDN